MCITQINILFSIIISSPVFFIYRYIILFFYSLIVENLPFGIAIPILPNFDKE